jgi:Dam-replacing HTH domain
MMNAIRHDELPNFYFMQYPPTLKLRWAGNLIIKRPVHRSLWRRWKAPLTQRGWTLDVLNIVRRLVESRRRGHETPSKKSGIDQSLLTSAPTNEFTTADAYIFERELEQLHPDNRHVRDKIRQQLQILRDMGLLIHVGRGEWRLP